MAASLLVRCWTGQQVARANFGCNNNPIAIDMLQCARKMGMTAVLIGTIPKCDASLKPIDKQVNKFARPQIRLVGTPAPAIGASTKTELRDQYTSRAEFDSFHGKLLSLLQYFFLQFLVY